LSPEAQEAARAQRRYPQTRNGLPRAAGRPAPAEGPAEPEPPDGDHGLDVLADAIIDSRVLDERRTTFVETTALPLPKATSTAAAATAADTNGRRRRVVATLTPVPRTMTGRGDDAYPPPVHAIDARCRGKFKRVALACY